MTQGDLLSWVPHNGTDTSRAAAESMVPVVSALEREVLAYVTMCNGSTCDEVEVDMFLAHQTASARLRGLFLKGLIRDSGTRRKTRSGRAATVWVAA